MKPEFVNSNDLTAFLADHPAITVHDSTELAVQELFDIAYPEQKDTKAATDIAAYKKQLIDGRESEWGNWVFYPWLQTLVHFPSVTELRQLRTSRNRNLITSQEQQTLYDATILIVGMSVGSNIVEALVSQGIGGTFILADMDIIEPSNLNRIRSPYHHVGLHKVEAISRKVWEIDPYLNIIDYRDGLNEQNLMEILSNNSVDIIIDEMDELRMKVIVREAAQQHSIPVIMAADDGDDALVDIERYDLNSDMQLFNGRIPADILEKIKQNKLPRPVLGMMIGKYFVGSNNIPLRMFTSLGEVGKTLPSWPQLGGAAALSGISLAYVSKKILLGHSIREGQILVSLDAAIDLEHQKEDHKAALAQYQSMLDAQQL